MSKPIKQHIVSATVLKRFSKNKEELKNDFIKLGDNYTPPRSKNKEYADASCYQINKDDFNSSEIFKISEKNIINTTGNSFCYNNIYSIREQEYKDFFHKFNILTTSTDNEIKFLLERDFSKLETKYGNFIKSWNDNEINFMNLNEYKEEIINFISSNELRAKHLYKNNKKQKLELNLIDYSIFDKTLFLSFIKIYINNIFDNIDYYEMVELNNYLNEIDFLEDHDLRKKMLAKLNNKNDLSNKDVLFINNNTEICYLLSDIATSIFYDNYKMFDEILEIIGLENFNERPSKLSIMPLQHNLIAVVSDKGFNSNYITQSNKNIIKKINSLICSKINDWLVVYDVTKTKDELIDKDFFKKVNKINNFSNCMNWYHQALNYTSFSNDKFGYIKIEAEDYRKIKPMILLLNKLHTLTKELNDHGASYAHIGKDEIRVYHKENGYIVGKINNMTSVLVVNKRKFYDVFNKLTEEQLKTLEHALLLSKISNHIYLDKVEKKVIFYKHAYL